MSDKLYVSLTLNELFQGKKQHKVSADRIVKKNESINNYKHEIEQLKNDKKILWEIVERSKEERDMQKEAYNCLKENKDLIEKNYTLKEALTKSNNENDKLKRNVDSLENEKSDLQKELAKALENVKSYTDKEKTQQAGTDSATVFSDVSTQTFSSGQSTSSSDNHRNASDLPQKTDKQARTNPADNKPSTEVSNRPKPPAKAPNLAKPSTEVSTQPKQPNEEEKLC